MPFPCTSYFAEGMHGTSSRSAPPKAQLDMLLGPCSARLNVLGMGVRLGSLRGVTMAIITIHKLGYNPYSYYIYVLCPVPIPHHQLGFPRSGYGDITYSYLYCWGLTIPILSPTIFQETFRSQQRTLLILCNSTLLAPGRHSVFWFISRCWQMKQFDQSLEGWWTHILPSKKVTWLSQTKTQPLHISIPNNYIYIVILSSKE